MQSRAEHAPAAKTQVATTQSTLPARPHAAEPRPAAPAHWHGSSSGDELLGLCLCGRSIRPGDEEEGAETTPHWQTAPPPPRRDAARGLVSGDAEAHRTTEGE